MCRAHLRLVSELSDATGTYFHATLELCRVAGTREPLYFNQLLAIVEQSKTECRRLRAAIAKHRSEHRCSEQSAFQERIRHDLRPDGSKMKDARG
jgi:hypothetical protein